jgi:isoleucyl-tRNA synthetase
MLTALIKLLAPILVHTCEEAWANIPHRNPAEPDSVHLALLPEFDEAILEMAEDLRPVNEDLGRASTDKLEAGPAWIWDRLLGLRADAMVQLEAMRNAGVKNPLDTEAVFSVAPGDTLTATFIQIYLHELEDLMGVGHARWVEADDLEVGQAVRVDIVDTRKEYRRCDRSWKRRPDVGHNSKYPDLCARDAAVMEELAQA